jgi:hypothetical protein
MFDNDGENEAANPQNQEQEESIEKEDEEEEIVLVDNDIIKATYKGLTYEKSVDMNYMLVYFENKTDGEITVYPKDSSVDDEMIMFGSGIPTTMQGHKNMNQAFIIGQKTPTDNIELKFRVEDGDFNELLETDVIHIDIK